MINDEIFEIIKKANKEKKHLTHITNKQELSFEERVKISLCRHFVHYVNERRITVTEFAKEMNLPKSRVSEIVNYKITKYTVDKLLTHLTRLAELSPKTKAYLDLLRATLEVPPMTVTNTKKLTRSMSQFYA